MSSWSEAVWVVKKLQKSMNFSQQILGYTTSLNNLNQRVNELNQDIINKTNIIDNIQNQIINKNTVIEAQKREGNVPDTTEEFSNNAIWFVIQ